jgi:hypothetical protein
MATQSSNPSERRIVGAIITGGHVYRAGEEDALARRLGPRSIHRLTAEGQITGDWLAQQAPEQPQQSGDETDGTDNDEPGALPSLRDMDAHLATITDLEALDALEQQDHRKGAAPMYAARRAELTTGGE